MGETGLKKKTLVDPESHFLYRGTGGRFTLVSLPAQIRDRAMVTDPPDRPTFAALQREQRAHESTAVVSPPLRLEVAFRQSWDITKMEPSNVHSRLQQYSHTLTRMPTFIIYVHRSGSSLSNLHLLRSSSSFPSPRSRSRSLHLGRDPSAL